MKLETAIKVIRLLAEHLAEKKKGSRVTIHIGPDRVVAIEKTLTIRHEEIPTNIVEKFIDE